MDWANEPYVRVYTRETDDDLALSYDALSLWNAMLKKFDRAGLIETKRGIAGLAAITRCPIDRVPDALTELLKDGRVVQVSNGYFAPNFLAAQETPRTDKARQRDSRSKRAARANSERRETPSMSHGVTLTSADPRLTSAELASADLGSAGDLQNADVEHEDSLPLPPYQPLRDVSRSPEQSLEHDLHESKQRFATAGKLGGEVWERLRAMRKAIAAELGVEVRDLHPHDAGRRALAMRIREAVDAKREPAQIGADLNHVLDVFVAEARHTRSVQWLTGGMFEDRSFRRALGMTLADVPGAARRSNGDRGKPPDNGGTPNVIRVPAWGDHTGGSS